MQSSSSITIMPPEPMIDPSSCSDARSRSAYVDMVRGNDTARGSAGLNRLELFAVGNATADVVDDVPQGRAHRDLDQARSF